MIGPSGGGTGERGLEREKTNTGRIHRAAYFTAAEISAAETTRPMLHRVRRSRCTWVTVPETPGPRPRATAQQTGTQTQVPADSQLHARIGRRCFHPAAPRAECDRTAVGLRTSQAGSAESREGAQAGAQAGSSRQCQSQKRAVAGDGTARSTTVAGGPWEHRALLHRRGVLSAAGLRLVPQPQARCFRLYLLEIVEENR